MPGSHGAISSPTLDELQRAIHPDNIAYYSEGGATPSAAIRVCKAIREVSDPGILEPLLQHSRTLHAPLGKEFPIARIRRAITETLEQLRV